MKVTKTGGIMYIEYKDQRLMLVSKQVNSIQVQFDNTENKAVLTVVQWYPGLSYALFTTLILDTMEDAQLLYKEILRANHLGEFEEEKETSKIIH